MLRQITQNVDLLILGAGWTSQFLIPELNRENITHAETTTTGRDNTIPFKFDPNSSSLDPYKALPSADTILITFPLKGHGQSKHLTSLYRSVHGSKNQWIQLGSTGIFNKDDSDWTTEDSEYDTTAERAIAEDELRECVGGCVLNLSGLYGGTRLPKNWIPRLAKSKEDIRNRNSVHFIHGEDVARAIIATHRNFELGCVARRWIITDLRVYDWWDLIMSFSALAEGEGGQGETEEKRQEKLRFARWVGDLMVEEGVRALPRGPDALGRKLDGRGFWRSMGIWPRHARLA